MAAIDRLTSEKFGIPSIQLMENAGSAVAEFILSNYGYEFTSATSVGVICGKGNNGGDGLVAARKLQQAGRRVQVLLLAEPRELRGDAAAMLERLGNKIRPIIARNAKHLDLPKARQVFECDVLVDAILGTGFRPPLNDLYREAIHRMLARGHPVVAVDIPSGLQSDFSNSKGAEIATPNAIVTFTAPKPSLIFDPAVARCELVVAPIGSSPKAISSKLNLEVITPYDFEILLQPRKPDAHKGDFGHVLVIAGSVGKSGAAAMAGLAALRAGAGLVTVATPRSVLPLVAGFAPELMTEPLPETSEGTVSLRALQSETLDRLMKGKTVVALGPGLTTNSETTKFIRGFVEQCELPLVLDADGLNAFAGVSHKLPSREALVLTPHPGEMARLTGASTKKIQRDRMAAARRFARERKLLLVLKGSGTLIAEHNGRVWVNPTGNPAMAKGGVGDVLTGIIAGLLAQFPQERLLPVLAAVYLHGLAGDTVRDHMNERTLLATDLLRALPHAFNVARRRTVEKTIRIR
jgi:NAD(P)H-hydrate epimerase